MPEKILFVDEEQYVLKALQRSFRNLRSRWDMQFVITPQEALKVLSHTPVDILVSETLFAGHSGLDLLHTVKEKWPHIVRIILSGHSDRNVVLKYVDLAHQYLGKPCDDDDLKATIERALLMRTLLSQPALKDLISRIDSLPTLPDLYLELCEELKSEEASIGRVAAIVAKDLGLTVKILKLVNSAFFGLPQRIIDPVKAVGLLGMDLIKAVVLTSATLDQFKKIKRIGFSLEAAWDHAVLTATFSKTIARSCGLDAKAHEMVFMAALLHDIGKLVIAAYLPQEYKRIQQRIRTDRVAAAQAEMAVLGTNHAMIGAYLLGLWGLPDPAIQTAAFHHTPYPCSDPDLPPFLIVHIADAIVHWGSRLGSDSGAVPGLDYALLEEVQLLDRIEEWRNACVAHADSSGG